MLKKLIIRRFKSIEEAELTFGKLNIFVGTNASGKSNFFDALRVLQGIGYGFTIDEIFHGKSKTSSSIEWEGIRGGIEGAVFKPIERKRGRPSTPDSTTTFELDTHFEFESTNYYYKIKIHAAKSIIISEEFSYGDSSGGRHNVFSSTSKKTSERIIDAKIYQGKTGKPPIHQFNRHMPILYQINDLSPTDYPFEYREKIASLMKLLEDTQKLDLIPKVLREYSKQFQAERIGERGENFAALVKYIISDRTKKDAYEGWLKKLTPTDLNDITVKKGALGEPIFGVIEGKNTILAPLLSDGTLRFAALTAALFQKAAPHILLLEEVDNGIHPTRLRLLMELLVSRADRGQSQIFVTTHSPILLAWIKPELYNFTFHCSRQSNGSSIIQPVNKIENFKSIVKKQPFSDLFAEGWLENSL